MIQLDVEMPKHCGQCPMIYYDPDDGFTCGAIYKQCRIIMNIALFMGPTATRPSNCPLIEIKS